MWRAAAKNSAMDDGDATAGKFFKTVWFDDNLNGKIKKDADADRGRDPDGDEAGTAEGTANHDARPLRPESRTMATSMMIWEFLTDSDMDPNAGDLGKVDMAERHGHRDDRRRRADVDSRRVCRGRKVDCDQRRRDCYRIRW